MIVSVLQPGSVSCGLFVLLVTALFSSEAANAVSPPSPSHVAVEASLSLASLRQRMREVAAASPSMEQVEVHRQGPAGISADLRFTPRPAQLAFNASRDGSGSISIPVDVQIEFSIPRSKKVGVSKDGCGDKARFHLVLWFTPRLKQGRLTFVAAGASAPGEKGYRCIIRTNLLGGAYTLITKGKAGVSYDVGAEIERGLVAKGQQLLDNVLPKINALLPDQAALLAYVRAPARFGTALALGIEQPKLRFTGITATGDRLVLEGTLEGYPRLQFGSDWNAPESTAHEVVGNDGFHLPVTLLLPTDKTLQPDDILQRASVWLGDFRLLPVSGRPEVAVLQRRRDGDIRDVVWLSGSLVPSAGDRVQRFDRPMVDVLQEIADWLADPELWRDVDGIPMLQQEVADFQRLVAHFQEDTALPLDTRGMLQFRALRVDLRRLWVSTEAILADVALRGTARLQIDLASNLQ